MNPIILYQDDIDWRQEAESAKKYFNCIPSRMLIKKNDLVIPRYSALPFYKELEHDINYVGAKLINTYTQHRYVADLRNWAEDLKGLTPKTWYRTQDIPEIGPFILKGETNSKKYLWKTHMFANNKKEAIEIESKLYTDSMLTYQNIYVREYISLKTFMIGIQDLPITNEYRFFCYKDKILSGGYYWSSHVEDIKDLGINVDSSNVPVDFLMEVIGKVKNNINFYVIDVAETSRGDWIVVELNDGCCSGLSENCPDILYKNLKNAI
jgi:hypothetical protein